MSDRPATTKAPAQDVVASREAAAKTAGAPAAMEFTRDTARGVDLRDLVDIPDKGGPLGSQTDQDSLPVQDEPQASPAPVADSLLEEVGISGPADTRAEELSKVGVDPTTLDDLLGVEDLLAGQHRYGGADGRNPASDSGGPTQPGAEPYPGAAADVAGAQEAAAGLAGKVPPHQQAVLDKLAQMTQDAAAAGDHDAADRYYNEFVKYQQEIGMRPETPAPDAGGAGEGSAGGGSAGGQATDVVNTGSATPVAVDENGAPVATEGQKELAEEWKGGNLEGVANLVSGNETTTERGQALTQAMNEIADQSQPAPAVPNQDVGQEQGLSGPAMWEDFTDAFHDQQTGGLRGGDVDPNPNADAWASIDGHPDTDFTSYVADYGPDAAADDGVARPLDLVPDEEFFEA